MGFDKKEYFKKYYNNRRTKYINMLGGKCIECAGIDNLEFDHINPSTKVASIGDLLKHSEKRLLDELSKCQLLCKACHLNKSKKEGVFTLEPKNKGKWKHGTTTSYMYKKCRCQECKSFYSVYKKQRRKERGWK